MPEAAWVVLCPSGKRPHPCACGFRVRAVAAPPRRSKLPAPAARARCYNPDVLRAAAAFHRWAADHHPSLFCSGAALKVRDDTRSSTTRLRTSATT